MSTKNELLRVYRESIRRGELASLCLKTKRGRETLTLSVPGGSSGSQSRLQGGGVCLLCAPTIFQCAPRQKQTTAMTKQCKLPKVEQIKSSTTMICKKKVPFKFSPPTPDHTWAYCDFLSLSVFISLKLTLMYKRLIGILKIVKSAIDIKCFCR